MSSNPKRGERRHLERLEKAGLGPLTIDDFLGGRVRLIQLREGYRAGMDAVLLAAAVPAREGESALDAGAGNGAPALCLAKRIGGLTISGIEIQRDLVRLAEANIALNGCGGRVKILEGSIAEGHPALAPGSFDHVMVNPPYFGEGEGLTPSGDSRGIATTGPGTTLADWVDYAVRMARPRGSITFIYRADRCHELIGLLKLRAGDMVVFPLWPKRARPAKRILIQARKGMLGPAVIAPGLTLHGANQRYTRAAERVLREGQAIDLSRYHRRGRA